MESELFYRIALSRVPGIGPFLSKTLIRQFGDATTIFRTPAASLARIRGIGKIRAWAISGFKQYGPVEKELSFLEKYKIRALFFTDKDYPHRLCGFSDSPALIYYKGSADLNSAHIVGIVGTRTPSEQAKQHIARIVAGLTLPGILVASGLAYGIDGLAHAAALQCHLPTVGVLGHGLDRIYPAEHTSLARQMVQQGGGLLTEFGIGTEPAEHNFPLRNRIIAAMSDALIVVESGRRGGSMLTVENAIVYRKSVYALPGRVTDKKSVGTNELIRKGKARLLDDIRQLIGDLGWDKATAPTAAVIGAPAAEPSSPEAAGLSSAEFGGLSSPKFAGLSPAEKAVLECVHKTGTASFDEIMCTTGLSVGLVPRILFDLNVRGLIHQMPGQFYRIG